MVDVVQRHVPHAAELDALVGRGLLAGRRHRHDHRLVLAEIEVPRRRELGRQAARRRARLGHRVHRQLQVEPLGEGEERPEPGQQDLARHAVTLGQRAGVRRGRRGPAAVGPADADRAAPLGAPVAVHLADQEHRRPGAEGDVAAPGVRPGRAEPQLERPVAGDLDLPVVERGQAVRHLDRGVVAGQHLEAQVGGGAAAPGDHVLRIVAQVGVEVQGVRVVQAQLGVRAGRLDEVREVPLVRPGQLQRGPDAPGQVVIPLGQVLLGLDVGRAGDDLLGLEHRVRERLSQRNDRGDRAGQESLRD